MENTRSDWQNDSHSDDRQFIDCSLKTYFFVHNLWGSATYKVMDLAMATRNKWRIPHNVPGRPSSVRTDVPIEARKMPSLVSYRIFANCPASNRDGLAKMQVRILIHVEKSQQSDFSLNFQKT
jgi:hypothetical protein